MRGNKMDGLNSTTGTNGVNNVIATGNPIIDHARGKLSVTPFRAVVIILLIIILVVLILIYMFSEVFFTGLKETFTVGRLAYIPGPSGGLVINGSIFDNPEGGPLNDLVDRRLYTALNPKEPGFKIDGTLQFFPLDSDPNDVIRYNFFPGATFNVCTVERIGINRNGVVIPVGTTNCTSDMTEKCFFNTGELDIIGTGSVFGIEVGTPLLGENCFG